MICILLLTAGAPAGAQQEGVASPRPRVGLALSGGSAKGLAHIGVIQVLGELGVPIDVVSGTSMGALVGGLYAAGLDGPELEEVASDLEWSSIFGGPVDRRLITADQRLVDSGTTFSFPFQGGRIGLPSSALRSGNIMRLLQRLTWPVQQVRDFRDLRVPFAAVATDIETGEAVVLTSGRLAEAMRASMALAGIFSPIRVNGRTLIDGGYVRNLPAEDARALGADIVICSDVTSEPQSVDDLQTLIDVFLQTVTFQIEAGAAGQRGLCDVLVRPTLEGLGATDFGAGDEWIERGREATLDQTAALRGVAAGADGRERPAAMVARVGDSIRVERIEIVGLSAPKTEAVALRALALPPSGPVTASTLDEALARLYATQLFTRAAYRIDTAGPDTVLVFDMLEQATNRVGFGLRYDDHRKASLLFAGTLRNWLEYGSTLRLNLRLGDQAQVGALYLHGMGIVSSFSYGMDASFTRGVFDMYDEGRRRTEVRSDVMAVGGLVGRTMSRRVTALARLGLERARHGSAISPLDAGSEATFVTMGVSALRNTLNSSSFPTRGHGLRLTSVVADSRLDGGGSYSHHLLDVEQLLPLSRTSVLRARVMVGGAKGNDTPIHRYFFLGGAYPSAVFGETQPAFWGLGPQERSGKAVQLFRLGVQQQIREGVFANAGVNTGNTFTEWAFRPEDYLFGWGMSLGAATLLGPVEITAHGRRFDERPDLEVNIGYAF